MEDRGEHLAGHDVAHIYCNTVTPIEPSSNSNSIMRPLQTGVILVDPNFRSLTHRFLVEDTANDSIGALKKKVHEMWAAKKGLSHYDPTDFVVWQLKGELIIQNVPRRRFHEKLSKIDVEDNETIRLLAEEDKVVDLGLLVGQSLLVQIPGTRRTPCISTIVVCVLIQFLAIPKDVNVIYKRFFLKAYREGFFTKNDLKLNDVDVDFGTPKFVKCYEDLLSRKRKVTPHVRYIRILYVRHLTKNEVRSVRQQKRCSSPIKRFLTNIFPRRRNPLTPLTLSTDPRLSTSSKFCPPTLGVGKLYTQIKQRTLQNATHTGCFFPESRSIMRHLPQLTIKQKSPLNSERQCIWSIHSN